MLFTPRSTRCTRAGARTTVHVDGLTDGLCGASRPDATSTASPPSSPSCSRSSGRAAPTSGARTPSSSRSCARMAADLDLPVEVVGLPARARARRPRDVEPQRLPRRRRAPRRDRARRGRCARRPTRSSAASATPHASARLVVDTRRAPSRWSSSTTPRSSTPPTLEPLDAVDGDVLVALAALVGTTRLIDNVAIAFDGDAASTPTSASLTASPERRRRPLMHRIMMKSKIHRATVTGADLHYVGSITLDPRLMELADIREYEQVHVLDIDNGARFETYAIRRRARRRDPQRRRRPARAARRQGDRHHLRGLRRRRARRLRAARRARRRAEPARSMHAVRGRAVATP